VSSSCHCLCGSCSRCSTRTKLHHVQTNPLIFERRVTDETLVLISNSKPQETAEFTFGHVCGAGVAGGLFGIGTTMMLPSQRHKFFPVIRSMISLECTMPSMTALTFRSNCAQRTVKPILHRWDDSRHCYVYSRDSYGGFGGQTNERDANQTVHEVVSSVLLRTATIHLRAYSSAFILWSNCQRGL